jgi:flavin reductase (DIM6/NTAB) family NADH-FMN oxidoreductase RutF/DNA-binding GntR family transcriptional regulator
MTTAIGKPTVGRVGERVFREVIGRFASGVTVVTARVDDQDFGTTASAVSSLSLEPPMMLVCLNRGSETQGAILRTGWFAVNILSETQALLAYKFAKNASDKLRDVDVKRLHSGSPLLSNALAHIECRVTDTATGGTHTIFLGEVLHAAGDEGAPLTYYRGRFGRFRDMRQDEAYRRIRGLLVARELSRGEPLDVERLARDEELSRADVFYALTKLMTDGLVQREADGRLFAKPLDVKTAHEAIDARRAIETAVVDAVAGAVPDDDLDKLRSYARAAQAAAASRPVDMASLGRAGHQFHLHFVGLLRNEALTGFVRRLEFHALWATVAPDLERMGKVSVALYLPELVEACAAGRRDEAKRLLDDHAATIKEYARDAIERAGGAT